MTANTVVNQKVFHFFKDITCDRTEYQRLDNFLHHSQNIRKVLKMAQPGDCEHDVCFRLLLHSHSAGGE